MISSHVMGKTNEDFTGLHKDVYMGHIGDVALTIDIAFPKSTSPEPRPIVVFVHGGGFKSGNKSSKHPQMIKFTQKGYVSASAMYRFSPTYKFPSQIEDIQLAIRFLKANAEKFNIDPNRIIISGSSAGSYLAVMAGVAGNSDAFSHHNLYAKFDASVRAVTAQSAPIGNFELSKYSQSLPVKRLLNIKSSNFEVMRKKMSPVEYLDPQDPPFFLSHGDEDPLVPVSMSREFVEKLKELELTYEYHEVKGGTHSFSKSQPKQAKVVFAHYLAFIDHWAH